MPSLAPWGCGPSEAQRKKEAEIKSADYHYKSANGFFESHQVPLAIRELTFALEKDPDHMRAHYLLGYIYLGRKQYAKATHHFKESLRIDPKFFDATNSLGATYLAQARWEDAASLFEQLLLEPLYTSQELAYNNLGWSYYNMRNYPRALEHFNMSVFLKPQFCLGYNNIGLTFEAMHNTTEAARQYVKAIEYCPTNYAEPHFNLGKLYQTQGQGGLAQSHFQRCVELSPRTSIGERCMQYLGSY